ncbi:MAG: hypothetical protein J2P55_00035 [Rhizobiales bacterium]|nr:hypothetical protein [Hyphomicrobiales bacterium]
MRTKYGVTWCNAIGKDQHARFSDRSTALRFARAESNGPQTTYVEVRDNTGLIAQFSRGKATPEFAHLDANLDA